MKYFVFFSTILLILYLVEFVKKDNRTFTFMDKDFTTAMQYIVICYILFFSVKMMSEKLRVNEMWILIVAFAVWFIADSCFFADSGMPFLRARQMLSFPLGVMIAKNREKIERYSTRKRTVILVWGGYNRYTLHGNHAVICG